MTKYLSLILLVALALAAAVGGRFLLMQGGDATSVTLGARGGNVGGPFTLTDHTGKTVTEKDFLGKPFLVYFGYTYCPDICPTTLSAIQDALDIVGDKAKDVPILLITVDPERDTVEALADYVSYFHPNTVGLTGTPEQVTAVARAYKAYYAKAMDPNDDNGFYLVDHSAFTYLMGAEGTMLALLSHGVTPEEMAERIGKFL